VEKKAPVMQRQHCIHEEEKSAGGEIFTTARRKELRRRSFGLGVCSWRTASMEKKAPAAEK
jgi:hypothetical protein